MAKYRPIKTNTWDDDYIFKLDSDEKLVWIFLLTNERTSLCGIYKISISYIYRMTKVSEERIKAILEKFEKDDRIKYIDNTWISIKNVVKHHSTSPKITDGIVRELSEIPQDVAKRGYHIDRVGINLYSNLYSNSNLNLNSNEKVFFNKKTNPSNCQFCKASGKHEDWCQLFNSKK
jgi:hypothetical protein